MPEQFFALRWSRVLGRRRDQPHLYEYWIADAKTRAYVSSLWLEDKERGYDRRRVARGVIKYLNEHVEKLINERKVA